MTLPDWQLPAGVDRGLWDYLHSGEMVGGYDAQLAASPLARADVAFCEAAFPVPGRLVDLGCGTGRLCLHFAAKGFDCVGVDLSEEMLARGRAYAAAAGANVGWIRANLVDLKDVTGSPFDYAACLFSTLGMVRGAENRRRVVASAARLLRLGGRLVLHVHNRWFTGLGVRRMASQVFRSASGRVDAGDATMPQAYGGAALTLHHFTRRGAVQLLEGVGFRVRRVTSLGLSTNGRLKAPWCLGAVRAYGFLVEAEKAGG